MTLSHLGQSSQLPASPEEAQLDYVPNPRPGRPYLVRFTAPEFASLCPVTEQPDFAHLVIDYAPAELIVESKSLKLFLGSFRNHCGFHEDVTVGIGERLFSEMKPLWIRIGGYWYPRGGMPIDVFWQSGDPPPSLWLPDQGVPSYRGRGQPLAASPHIVVLGAGSVGCFNGGAWTAAGLDISFIGRRPLADEISAAGITVTDQDGWKSAIPPEAIRYSTKAAALAKADIILLTTKSTGTEAAARQILAHAKRKPPVISFQNGITNAELIQSLLPGFKVLQAMIPYNVVRLGPGKWHRATWGELTAAKDPVTQEIAKRIGDRKGRLLLSDNMPGVAWGKLLFNLNNAINALSGMTILEELRQRDYRRVLAAAILETLELLEAAGIEPEQIGEVPPKLLPHAIGAPDFIFKNLFLRVQKIDPRARSSMADDFDAGRPTEIDYLNGEVVKLAKKLGRSAPVNQTIVDLVKQREAGVEHLWGSRDLRNYVLEGRRPATGFGY